MSDVKEAIARGEKTYEELGLADPVSLKFFGKFAEAVASGSAPVRQDVDIPLTTGGVSSVKWSGEVTEATFYNFMGAPRAAIYFDDKIVGVVSDIEFGELRKTVYWIDCVLSKSLDVMFDHIIGKQHMPK